MMKKFLKNEEGSSDPAVTVMVLLGLTILFLIVGTIRDSEAEANMNSKREFITSENFERLEVSYAEWQARKEGSLFIRVENPYDLFAVETEDEELFQLKVYDSPVNGKYLVEIFER